jgi:AAA+ superfamily predicted ATPase
MNPLSVARNSLVLPGSILRRLTRVSDMLRHWETLEVQGIEIPNVLLHGPPGTGKTTAAETLANESGLPLVKSVFCELGKAHAGQYPEVKLFFDRARDRAPCLVYLDAIDGAMTSGPRDPRFHDVVDYILGRMGGIPNQRGIFFLATANDQEQIDPRLLRQFHDRIAFPLLDEDQRRGILMDRLTRERYGLTDLPLDQICSEIAARTDGANGRDLHGLVQRALKFALDRSFEQSSPDFSITREDLLRALQRE